MLKNKNRILKPDNIKPMAVLVLILLAACQSRENSFQLCGIGIVKPYYVTGLSYPGEIYEIERKIEKKYIPVMSGLNSGILRIYFDVNCSGQSGNYKFEEYSLEYVKITLNDSIRNQLISYVKELDPWNAGLNVKGKEVNSFKFLAFKILNGHLIEVLPK